jgi:outer membrane protein OmpA-like peptidoglycan-associated protein
VLFDFDKSTIKPEADNVGTEAYNMGLSNRRWMSVRDYVVKKGVEGGRVSGQGFGESKPIASNATAEGRAKNRRVEIKVN